MPGGRPRSPAPAPSRRPRGTWNGTHVAPPGTPLSRTAASAQPAPGLPGLDQPPAPRPCPGSSRRPGPETRGGAAHTRITQQSGEALIRPEAGRGRDDDGPFLVCLGRLLPLLSRQRGSRIGDSNPISSRPCWAYTMRCSLFAACGGCSRENADVGRG
jgi:hypothetical protein